MAEVYPNRQRRTGHKHEKIIAERIRATKVRRDEGGHEVKHLLRGFLRLFVTSWLPLMNSNTVRATLRSPRLGRNRSFRPLRPLRARDPDTPRRSPSRRRR